MSKKVKNVQNVKNVKYVKNVKKKNLTFSDSSRKMSLEVYTKFFDNVSILRYPNFQTRISQPRMGVGSSGFGLLISFFEKNPNLQKNFFFFSLRVKEDATWQNE